VAQLERSESEDGLAGRSSPAPHGGGADLVRLHHRSLADPEQEYIGASEDLKQRMTDHNAGKSTHTAKFKPWELLWYCAFPDKHKALEFERYLKSHSGRAFSKKRLTR
jgi:putative endonuclease